MAREQAAKVARGTGDENLDGVLLPFARSFHEALHAQHNSGSA
jgi:hypothetical protein